MSVCLRVRRGNYKIYDGIILSELAHYDIITAIIRHVMQLVRSHIPVSYFVFCFYRFFLYMYSVYIYIYINVVLNHRPMSDPRS